MATEITVTAIIPIITMVIIIIERTIITGRHSSVNTGIIRCVSGIGREEFDDF